MVTPGHLIVFIFELLGFLVKLLAQLFHFCQALVQDNDIVLVGTPEHQCQADSGNNDSHRHVSNVLCTG
jgi:hypothetical protein